MKITVEVCNVCQDPNRPVTEYCVTEGGRIGRPTLCAEHAPMLEQFLDDVPPVAAPKPRSVPAKPQKVPAKKATSSGRRGGRRGAATMEEIEASKRG